MEINGQIRITCPTAVFLQALRDPASWQALLPGDSTATPNPDGTIAIAASRSFGPVRLNLPGTLSIEDVGDHHVLTVKAAHMVGGKVDIRLQVSFVELDPGVTRVKYDGMVTATGIASRVLAEYRKRVAPEVRNGFLFIRHRAQSGLAGQSV